jgi:hypothetical protein
MKSIAALSLLTSAASSASAAPEKPMSLSEAHGHILDSVAGVQQTYSASQGLCDKYTCCE